MNMDTGINNPLMNIDILTLFPGSMEHVLGESILGRASKKGIINITCRQIRDYTDNKQMQVDDYPYGGGWGCVMMAQPLSACLDAVPKSDKTRVIYMSPGGHTFTQEDAKRFVRDYDRLILICGHYEGIDQRFIDACVDEELSMGDFVVTGGEIPAMAVADAVCRLVPGVLADEECFTGESHWDGLLEYPQYTRPETWNGLTVPPVLLSGNHGDITRWRREQSLKKTMERRPDLFEKLNLTDKNDMAIVEKLTSPVNNEPGFDLRRADARDLDGIMDIVSQAQSFMKSKGINQWQDGYPNREAFASDMAKGECYVITCREKLAGMFTLSSQPEPGYENIIGAWLCSPYCTVHRIAVAPEFRGSKAAEEMLLFALELAAGKGAASVRTDTHHDNLSMQRLAKRLGFRHCGTVYLAPGAADNKPRMAFEKPLES